jgi:hypothetical protein
MIGNGLKKSQNMMEAPIYPDIKKSPALFKNSGKFWQVDANQTILDGSQSNTQMYGDAILARSYRDNIDRYGQSSYQEKIEVVRMPLQNAYEDYGPLNRLPTKIHAIRPHINPTTVNDSGGTSAYSANVTTLQNVDDHITDKLEAMQWRDTYFMPMDNPIDTSILPDLVMNLPTYSTSSGYSPLVYIDAPREVKISEVNKPTITAHPGTNVRMTTALTDQTTSKIHLRDTNPRVAAHSGQNVYYIKNVDTRLDELELQNNLPHRSVGSGVQSSIMIDGRSGLENLTLEHNLPETSISAGYNSGVTIDGQTRLDELELDYIPTTKLNVINPGSESGYQTKVEFYTPEDHLKIRENPKVQIMARPSFTYQDNSGTMTKEIHVRRKLEPAKSYGTGLNQGTILRAGVEQPKVNTRYFGSKSVGKI